MVPALRYFAALATATACTALLLAAGLVGFLPFNFPRARIFMGDAGSMTIGYLVAVVSVMQTFYDPVKGGPLAVAMPLVILAVPISVLAGFLGIGPGFLLMPTLILVGFNAKKAAGINAFAVCPPSFSSLIPHIGTAQWDFNLTVTLLAVGAAGLLKFGLPPETLDAACGGVDHVFTGRHDVPLRAALSAVTCAANGDCELQDMAGAVGLRDVRYGYEGENHLDLPCDESNPYFDFDPAKCIVCSRCVRASTSSRL